jgi:WD40 repeat protein
MYRPLARLAGRTVLASGHADGTVRLWDPVDRVPLPPLFQRPGRRVVSLTPVDFVNQPPWDGTELVALYDDLLVDVWTSASVHGQPSTRAPGTLAAAGHRRIIAAAVSPRRLGYRRPVLLADRNGTVSMWETFGVRLSDPLPPDPAHREVTAIAVLPLPGDGITVVTASRADSNLRAWQPLSGSAALIPLSSRPRCLLAVGDVLIIGHDNGLLALSLAEGPR